MAAVPVPRVRRDDGAGRGGGGVAGRRVGQPRGDLALEAAALLLFGGGGLGGFDRVSAHEGCIESARRSDTATATQRNAAPKHRAGTHGLIHTSSPRATPCASKRRRLLLLAACLWMRMQDEARRRRFVSQDVTR